MTGLAIVLIVLLVIVVLIVGMLANPVAYAFSIEGERPYGFDFRIRWWGRLFSIHVAYAEDKPFFKEVYILGKQVLGDAKDYQAWLSARVKEETEHVQEGSDDRFSYTETMENPADTVVEPEGPSAVGTVTSEEPPKIVEDENSAEEKTFKEKLAAIKDLFPKETPWWWHHLTNEALQEQFMIVGRRMYDHSKPREVYIEGEFGVGDPYRTGILASTMMVLWGEHMEHVTFDFLDYTAHGRGHLKGCIYPIVMVWYGTVFLLSRPVRNLLRDAAKAVKAAKATKAAKADQKQ